jgi:endoglycosylceramidase
MERRRFIAAGAAASAGLAGCLGGADDSDAGGDGGTGPDEGGGQPTACVGAAPSPAGTADSGQFLVDGRGRTLLLHGANVVYKREPYYPPPEVFDESDVEQIRGWGFNFVRLGAIWAGVQPARGEFDRAYLDRIRDLVDLFAEHDIYVLLDYHQNLYSHVLGGDGAPAWAVYTEGELEHYDHEEADDWVRNYAEPAVMNALRNFFTNREGIRDEYASAWRETAATLADAENVVGYSLMNEPTAPSGIYEFETDVLPAMYNSVIEEIRRVDSETPVWVEPSAATFNIGLETDLRGIEDPADSVVFSFHNYAPDSRDVVGNGVEAADRLGVPGVQTEFSTGNSAAVATMVDALDEELMGWAYWPYDESTKGWQSPAEYPPDFVGLDEGGGREHLPYLVRPYPQAVAGVPTTIAFDRVAREFRLAYDHDDDAAGETVVFVPERHFDDPAVGVEGASVRCREGAYLRVGDHTADSVTVTVSEEAVYRIEAVHSGKALTAPAGGDRTVHQHAPADTDRQRWRVTALADDSYRLDNVASGASLAVAGGSTENGGDIVQRPWTGDATQRWHVEVTRNAANTLRNAGSGLVADVADRSTADGANVHQWTYVDGENQQWHLRRA